MCIICLLFQYHSGVDLGVYAVLGMTQTLLVVAMSFAMVAGAVLGARTLHDNMLTAVLRSPMSFFDTTPLGRILNRFSKVSILGYLYDICTCRLICNNLLHISFIHDTLHYISAGEPIIPITPIIIIIISSRPHPPIYFNFHPLYISSL